MCNLGFVQFLTKSHVQTKTLYVIYDILEYWGYLESTCPGLINDILQEIKNRCSDTVEYSANLRRRCKTAGPELEHKMSMLQAVVIRQYKDSNPKNIVKTITYVFNGGCMIGALVLALLYLWKPDESLYASCLQWIGIICAHTVIITIHIHPCARDFAQDVNNLNISAFQLIWAVRDLAELLTCISESENPSLLDMLRAERFLKAFQASVCHVSVLSIVHFSNYPIKFLGGREELSRLRSYLQELPSWTDKNFCAHHWNDPDNVLLQGHCIAYQAPSTRAQGVFPHISRLSSVAATSICMKVSRMISRGDDGNIQTDLSRQNLRHLSIVKPEASTAAPIPVSTASGDGLSTTNSSQFLSVTQIAEDSAREMDAR
ncbi:uncharacterized protein EV420DRAFT_1767436 [Desarmillaria tabescens]|uniref:Uncharacterized protein n=1 Tax=Armillaria tabescens TaxID=1929756 RepID=A0AA39JUT4_ARMTA|nr:uncharacterized protein EV420DRAFT_1767436 [Desarmillaria tabescens]KAK0447849.1 hypothetical protein EV420DRAFT_1767436 [Desarmillaria tabescens]